jgi:hypothetical protein
MNGGKRTIMRKNRIITGLLVLVALMTVALLAARLFVCDDENVQTVEKRFGIHVITWLSRSQTTLPAEFNDANWRLKQLMIKRAGYDLAPYAGSKVTLEKYLILDTYHWSPLYLWLVLKDGKMVGAYLTVTEASGLVPGVLSLPEVRKRD